VYIQKRDYWYPQPCKPLKLRKSLLQYPFQEVSLIMARILHRQFSLGSCRASAWFLAFFFLWGLVCGVSACRGCGPEFAALMRGLPWEAVSIVGLILCLLFPFLISFASWVLDPVLLFPICFCRAFLFGFVHFGLFLSLGDGGWLLRWLVLFSDSISLPLLYCFWHRRLSGRSLTFLCCLALTALLIFIGTVDFYLILPKLGAFLSLQKG